MTERISDTELIIYAVMVIICFVVMTGLIVFELITRKEKK